MSTPDVASPGSSKTIACTRCNRSKVKCKRITSQTCERCLDAGIECEWRDNSQRKVVTVRYIQELKAHIRALERRVQELELEQSVADDVADPSIVDGVVVRDDLFAMFKEMENSVFGRFIPPGTTSSVAWGLSGKSQDRSWEIDPQDKDPSWLRRPPSPVYMPLPPPEVAAHYYNSQHNYIGTIFAFVRQNNFQTRLEEFYETGLPDSYSQESCLKYCQVVLVCAYGELYSVNQWTREGPPGLQFFKQAIKYLPNAHETGSILFVEVLGLVAYYLQVLNRRDSAFLYIGMALRMATSLGLHQELSDNTNVSAADREHRRRVWWSVYSMDCIISVKWGHPITIQVEDIGVALPSFLEELDGSSTSATVLACYTKLSIILGTIGGEIYRRKHTASSTLLTAIKLIMNELSAWSQALPANLRIDPDTSDVNVSREAISTHLHYYQCINMAARPLLFSVTQSRLRAIRNRTATNSWKEALPASVVSIIEQAIDGARVCTRITSAALRKNLVATYGFMDGEHAFSSALTLVMANIALDDSEANVTGMEMAMDVLQSMAQKGNRYVAYRHALLQNLKATIPSKSDGRQRFQGSIPVRGGTAQHGLPDSADTTIDPRSLPITRLPRPHFGLYPLEDTQEQDMNLDFLMEMYSSGVQDERVWIREAQDIQQEITNAAVMSHVPSDDSIFEVDI